METEAKKRVYYTKSAVNFMGQVLPGRSLVSSTRSPGPNWVVFNPAVHGIAYFAFDVDEREQKLNRSPQDDKPGRPSMARRPQPVEQGSDE